MADQAEAHKSDENSQLRWQPRLVRETRAALRSTHHLQPNEYAVEDCASTSLSPTVWLGSFLADDSLLWILILVYTN